MRSAKVIPISDDPHFADFAEYPFIQRVDDVVREDKGESWQFRAVLMAGALFVVMYVIPAIWRAMR